MTVLCWDGAMLAADSLFSYTENATRAFLGPKIKIYGKRAVASAGVVLEGEQLEQFEEWIMADMPVDQSPTGIDDDFSGIVLTQTDAHALYVKKFEDTTIVASYRLRARQSVGNSAASDYANALMDTGHNARDAVEKTCDYSLLCGIPVNSITRHDLKNMPDDYIADWEDFNPFDILKKTVKK